MLRVASVSPTTTRTRPGSTPRLSRPFASLDRVAAAANPPAPRSQPRDGPWKTARSRPFAASAPCDRGAPMRPPGRSSSGPPLPFSGPSLPSSDTLAAASRSAMPGPAGSTAANTQYGAHLPHVSAVAGQVDRGAQSIVLSGKFGDDIDLGEVFIYSGGGGFDLTGELKKQRGEDSFFRFSFLLRGPPPPHPPSLSLSLSLHSLSLSLVLSFPSPSSSDSNPFFKYKTKQATSG